MPPGHHVQDLQGLIKALTPPALPSLAHARSLASILSTSTTLPSLEVLNPIIFYLCEARSPLILQAAGYDILSAYCEHMEAVTFATSDRLAYFALILGTPTSWGIEIWEPRLRALRALTKSGADALGIEVGVIDLIKQWIKGAFDVLATAEETMERSERSECERSIDVLVQLLSDVMNRPEILARIPEETNFDVLQFFGRMVDSHLLLARETASLDYRSPPTTDSLIHESIPSHPEHKRNQSSISSSPIVSSSLILPRHPANIAISVYLNRLSSQIKQIRYILPKHLHEILPVLFRALAFSPHTLPDLPRKLQDLPRTSRDLSQGSIGSLSEKISESINTLLSGPYTATSTLILKKCLFPPSDQGTDNAVGVDPKMHQAIMTSFGAHRTLRLHIRRALSTRLVRAYISSESSMSYSYSGAPVHLDIERHLMERAWPKEDPGMSLGSVGGSDWDAGRLGKALSSSVEAWIKWSQNQDPRMLKDMESWEKIPEDAAGVLKDILHELDSREIDSRESDSPPSDDEEACIVGEVLEKLSMYIRPLKNPDGSSFIIHLKNSISAPSPLLRAITSLLSRQYPPTLYSSLPNTLLGIADHLTDADTAPLPGLMMQQHDLTPTSLDWLSNWERLLGNALFLNSSRPMTSRAIVDALSEAYEIVRDMEMYRKPLADLVLSFCRHRHAGGEHEDKLWKMLGEEIVVRLKDSKLDENTVPDALNDDIESYLQLILSAAFHNIRDEEEDSGRTATERQTLTSAPSPHHLPQIVMRRGSDYRDRDTALTPVKSILSTLATGSSSRSPVLHPHAQSDDPIDDTYDVLANEVPAPSRSVSAISTLIAVFSELSFMPNSQRLKNVRISIRIYQYLIQILEENQSARDRLTVLQFLMRLRTDKDHRVYFVKEDFDRQGLAAMLASMIHRHPHSHGPDPVDAPDDVSERRRARRRVPQVREVGHTSRVRRVEGMSRSTASRSPSRTTSRNFSVVPPIKSPDLLWYMPETSFPFEVSFVDSPSIHLKSYNAKADAVFPVSHYILALVRILEHETDWEILSYVLCHLPVQLSSKHLFCGPSSRHGISELLRVLHSGIMENNFAGKIRNWPASLKARDAQDLAYHILNVLVSYRDHFDLQQRHVLVGVIQSGLSGSPATVRCCLHALTLSAFELQPSVTKHIRPILEQLSQIMSNTAMTVHILGFLSIIVTVPPLYANFTEDNFKTVFGVALQYLQRYKRLHSTPEMSWTLSQYVRILSYFTLCTWFLAVKLPDRPRHVRFIVRQLLLANEGNQEVDEATEVCFDWLARYTYASADPKPSTSRFSEIVANPLIKHKTGLLHTEKTWLLGNSVVTVRAMPRLGWVEVLSRRPTGFSKFLCRIENVPLIGPGDVGPDLLTIPATLIMESEPPRHIAAEATRPLNEQDAIIDNIIKVACDEEPETSMPDPISGYVWRNAAPSQRRKQVAVDPSFLILQLSPYPAGVNAPHVKMVTESPQLSKFINSLDRTPVIDTHKVGVLYVAPGQTSEADILGNTFGSPAYTRFLDGIGRLVDIRGQVDVYLGGLDASEDGDYAYAWWDDIGQILFHTATMMPTLSSDPQSNNKKRHVGNDSVRIVWNDSGGPYRFETLTTHFQFVNIVIEPHSPGTIDALSDLKENEYFMVTVQRVEGMAEFLPTGPFSLISAQHLPFLVRQLALLADWYAFVYRETKSDTERVEVKTNWQTRLEAIKRFRSQLPRSDVFDITPGGVMSQEAYRDFTTSY